MKITPIEIERHQFQRVFRGCDPVEVKAFLSQVARQIEDLVRENQVLKETHVRLNDELSELRGHEAQLRNALASAGRVTDEMKEAAQKEAQLITAEATLEAEKIVANARSDLSRLTEENRGLHLQRSRLLSELKTIIDSHRRLVETQEELERQALSQKSNQSGPSLIRRV
ncbi:MAG: DivIVA domain-containing protein [Bradymonadia bacterium]